MRNGQNNKRMRGRNNNGGGGHNNNRRGQNPMTRVYESNGPDIKIRGTASHVAEKYVQLARDARSSGDPIAAENYYQHAEHYFRLIAAAQEQFRQNQPQPQPRLDDASEEGGDEEAYSSFGAEPGFAPQPQINQPYPRDAQQPREQRDNRGQQQPSGDSDNVDRLPSFITGGAQPASGEANGNGEAAGTGSGGRFGHRRRRRPRPDNAFAQGAQEQGGGDDASPGNE
ncbi:DUF4167 domain-containing protein [Afipia sp. TerB]